MAKKKYIISVLAVILFFGFASDVLALGTISTDKTSYLGTDEILYSLSNPTNESADIVVYETNAGTIHATCDNAGSSVSTLKYSESCFPLLGPVIGPTPSDGEYSFVVDTSGTCQGGLSYGACKGQSGFSSEARFSVGQFSSGANLTPDISILPFDRNVFGDSVEIKYEADDQDDARGNAVYGLGENPVSLYYFEGGSSSGRILIVENLPVLRQGSGQAGGSYVWNTENVPSGNTYRILAMVKDKILSVDTYASDFFHIDHSTPVFDLKLEPAATKGEDVRVFFEASEELIKLPEIIVVQKSYEPVKVVMKGISEGSIYRTVAGREVFKKFEGTYKAVSGYDGMADISVAGEDVAGNVGRTIKGNSRFAVGVEPPPRPVIISPLDKDITASDSVDVVGQARDDLEILLSVNGEGEFRVKPDKEGNFSVKSLPLSVTYNRGLNFITVIGRDSFGNTSEAAVVNVKLNLDPAVFVRFPQRDSNLNRIATITIVADDENNDELRFTYEMRPYNLPEARLLEENWTVLAEGIKETRLKFDSTKFPDGQYVLRITADDGFVRNETISETFYIRNFRPVISFSDGEKTIIGQSSYVLSGSVTIPEKVRETAKLVGLEYNLSPNPEARLRGTLPEAGLLEDGWVNVPLEISSDGFDKLTAGGFKAKFSISLADLKEKAHNILFRAKDSRGLDGNATKVLIVDFGPPLSPVVLSPLTGTVFSNRGETSIAIEVSPRFARFDEDPDKAGVQFTVSGTAEPESEILIEVQPQMVELLRSDLNNDGIEVRPQLGKVGADGIFSLQGVTLRKHGLSNLKIYALDAAGNKSPETELSVIYNNPPEIKFLNPRPNRGLDRREPVKWEAVDPDGDKVVEVKLSYRKGSQGIFRNIDMSKKLLSRTDLQGRTDLDNNFEWDVSGLAQGNYQLRLEATDGTSAGVKTIDFFIDNTAPEVKLEPLAKNVFTKEFILNMSGKAFDDLAGVEFVEFSLVEKVQSRDSLGSSASKLEAELPSRETEGGSVGEEVRLQRGPEAGLQDGFPEAGLLETWFKTTITRGFLAKEAAFRIKHKLKLDDGIYNVRFRAVDGAGNISGEAVQEVIVDTKPPRIGSYTIFDGSIMLLPENGRFVVPSGQEVDFKISLESDTKSATLNLTRSDLKGVPRSDLDDLDEVKPQPVSSSNLYKNNATGLWEAKPIFRYVDMSSEDLNADMSRMKMLISAEDENGNIINDKKIGEIEIIERGKISSGGSLVKDAKITVQVFDEDNQSFVNWQGQALGRENPVYTDSGGEYGLLLPAGEYQLLIKKKGFKNLKISTFNLERPRYINLDFELEPRKGVRGFIENIIENLTE